jgi:hypothetical protein
MEEVTIKGVDEQQHHQSTSNTNDDVEQHPTTNDQPNCDLLATANIIMQSINAVNNNDAQIRSAGVNPAGTITLDQSDT